MRPGPDAEEVLVTGAGGNVGRAVVASLLDLGVPVRAGERDPATLAATSPRCVPVRLDFTDAATFAPAVAGVRAVFLLRPPPISRVGPTLNAFIDAAVAADVDHIVFSSVAGADANVIVPHHRVETHLRASAVDHTILRPGFFAQNLGGPYLADIRDHDRIVVPAGDARVAFIDARDIGEVAARILAGPAHHRGAGHLLTGPEAVSFDEVAERLTGALGRPVGYEPATVLGYARHLRGQGLPWGQVAVQTVLHVDLRRGSAAIVDPTLEELLGRPPRTIDDYIDDHRDLWQSTADDGRSRGQSQQ